MTIDTNDDMRFINTNKVFKQKTCENHYYQIVINRNRIAKGFPPIRVERNLNKNISTLQQAKDLRNKMVAGELKILRDANPYLHHQTIMNCRWLKLLDLDLPIQFD